MTAAEYFVLDALWLLPTRPADFFHDDWEMLFNTPGELPPLSKAQRQQALDGLCGCGLIVLADGFYRLTGSGGLLWERVFAADWDGFYDCWFADKGKGRSELLEFCCAAEDVLTRFLSAHEELAGCRPERLSPFQATYWKTLPSGFRIRQDVPLGYGLNHAVNLPAWSLSLARVLNRPGGMMQPEGK